MRLVSERVVAADMDDAVEEAYRRGWTDGLPIVPPTESKVSRVLEYLGRDPQENLGIVPPKNGIATMEKVAINAVMAGCLPEHVPVVLAGLKAMLQPAFNLNGVQATTHCVAPLAIVSGPIVQKLGFNAADGCFGGGSRANATVGRALRLILWNIGGGYPGEIDKATFGHPGKYTYCIAENQKDNPWEPLHVERGLNSEDSAVTMFGCEAPHSVMAGPGPALASLDTIADSIATLGSNSTHLGGETLACIGPRIASVLAKAGFTRRTIKDYLYENARKPLGALKRGPRASDLETEADFRWPKRRATLALDPEMRRRLWPKWIDEQRDDAMVPIFERSEDIHIAVAGGWGATAGFCMVCPGWGHMGGMAHTQRIEAPQTR
ncbi:MAG: hypothetical protein HY684_04275 [Chloroflexi bacterium]|nr:hypothetical protein [Chloroflexota bacterium]